MKPSARIGELYHENTCMGSPHTIEDCLKYRNHGMVGAILAYLDEEHEKQQTLTSKPE